MANIDKTVFSNIFNNFKNIKDNISNVFSVIENVKTINGISEKEKLPIKSKNLTSEINSIFRYAVYNFNDGHKEKRIYTIVLGLLPNTSGYKWDKSIDDVNNTNAGDTIILTEVLKENEDCSIQMEIGKTYLEVAEDDNEINIDHIERNNYLKSIDVEVAKIHSDNDLIEPKELEFPYHAYDIAEQPNQTYIIMDENPNVSILKLAKPIDDETSEMHIKIAKIIDEQNLINSDNKFDINIEPRATYIYSNDGSSVDISEITKPDTDKTTNMHIQVAKVNNLEDLR